MKSMKSTLVLVFAIGMATAFLSCGNSQDNSKTASSVKTDIEQEQAAKVLNSYLEIKDALVKSDGESANKAAKKMEEILINYEDELAKEILSGVQRISGTKDVEQQRDHFNSLSENVYKLVKSTDANDIKLYKQYCPMAFDNTGAYWLSAQKEINNPYFGDRMLHCGSVKEEL